MALESTAVSTVLLAKPVTRLELLVSTVLPIPSAAVVVPVKHALLFLPVSKEVLLADATMEIPVIVDALLDLGWRMATVSCVLLVPSVATMLTNVLHVPLEPTLRLVLRLARRVLMATLLKIKEVRPVPSAHQALGKSTIDDVKPALLVPTVLLAALSVLKLLLVMRLHPTVQLRFDVDLAFGVPAMLRSVSRLRLASLRMGNAMILRSNAHRDRVLLLAQPDALMLLQATLLL